MKILVIFICVLAAVYADIPRSSTEASGPKTTVPAGKTGPAGTSNGPGGSQSRLLEEELRQEEQNPLGKAHPIGNVIPNGNTPQIVDGGRLLSPNQGLPLDQGNCAGGCICRDALIALGITGPGSSLFPAGPTSHRFGGGALFPLGPGGQPGMSPMPGSLGLPTYTGPGSSPQGQFPLSPYPGLNPQGQSPIGLYPEQVNPLNPAYPLGVPRNAFSPGNPFPINPLNPIGTNNPLYPFGPNNPQNPNPFGPDSQFPGGPMYPPGGLPPYPGCSPQFPGGSPQYPVSPQFPGGPQYPGGSPLYPGGSPQYAGGSPQYPGASPQYPGGIPQYPSQPCGGIFPLGTNPFNLQGNNVFPQGNQPLTTDQITFNSQERIQLGLGGQPLHPKGGNPFGSPNGPGGPFRMPPFGTGTISPNQPLFPGQLPNPQSPCYPRQQGGGQFPGQKPGLPGNPQGPLPIQGPYPQPGFQVGSSGGHIFQQETGSRIQNEGNQFLLPSQPGSPGQGFPMNLSPETVVRLLHQCVVLQSYMKSQPRLMSTINQQLPANHPQHPGNQQQYPDGSQVVTVTEDRFGFGSSSGSQQIIPRHGNPVGQYPGYSPNRSPYIMKAGLSLLDESGNESADKKSGSKKEKSTH